MTTQLAPPVPDTAVRDIWRPGPPMLAMAAMPGVIRWSDGSDRVSLMPSGSNSRDFRYSSTVFPVTFCTMADCM